MITRGIRELVGRDWSAARDSKDRFWGERIGSLGPAEGFRIAEELRRQVLLCNAAWPDEADRQADLAFHVRFADQLRRARPARRP